MHENGASSAGQILLPIILILAVGSVCYANSFWVPFVLDDISSIQGNPNIVSFSFALKPRILGELSFALDYKLHGLSLPGYHLVNLVLHLANSMLVFFCVRTIFRTPLMASVSLHGGGRHLPLAAALIFVSHPLQTAAVTYLAQRVSLLAAFFYLATVLLYLKSRLSADNVRTAILLLLSLLSAGAALLSKENAATVPLVITLCELTFFPGAVRKRILWCGFYFLPILLAIALTNRAFSLQADLAPALRSLTAEAGAPSRSSYLLTQFPVILQYLRLFLLPFGQNLDHDVRLRSGLLDPVVFLSLLLLTATVVVAVLLWFRGRRGESAGERLLLLAGFGIGWFYLAVSLESGLVPIRDVMFEHRVYLPAVGLVMTVAVLLLLAISRVSGKRGAAGNFAVVILIMVCGLSLMTFSRNRVWRSEVSIWEDAARKSPAKGRAYGALGHAYQRAGRDDDAVRAYRQALRLTPDDHIAHNNLGALYLKKGKYADAVIEFKRVLELSPATAAAEFNLGLAQAALGMLTEAEASFSEAVRLKPDYGAAQEKLATLRKVMAR